MLAGALLAAGCGGTRQDAGEPSGRFPMQILYASFPRIQTVARPASFHLLVHNPGARTVPVLAVTVNSFSYKSNYPGLASTKRPIWVIERGPGAVAQPPVNTQEVSQPGSGQTAYVDTWALGPLAPGATRLFSWDVVPVKPGVYTVRYAVTAGLSGKAKATTVTVAGAVTRQVTVAGAVTGKVTVAIARRPPKTYVNPNTGAVRYGSAPPSPSP